MNLLMASIYEFIDVYFIKSNRHIVCMRSTKSNIHYEVQCEKLLCINLINDIKSLTLYQASFTICLEKLPFSFDFIPFLIPNHHTWCVFDLLDVLTCIIERLICYIPFCHRPLRFLPLSYESFLYVQVPI